MIWFEVSFGYIRLMLGSVWQYLIPRTMLGWSRTGYGFVPLLGSSKVHIDINDYTSVIEQLVLHHVTDRKTGTRHPYHRFITHPKNMTSNVSAILLRGLHGCKRSASRAATAEGRALESSF